MSDGRAARGALYDLLRQHFGLQSDLDLCAAIYGPHQIQRSSLAALSTLIAQAAAEGDAQASMLFDRAADELVQLVDAVHRKLEIPAHAMVSVSYSGGMFQRRELLPARLQVRLERGNKRHRLVAPRLPPVAGAALYAAKLSGAPLSAGAVSALERSLSAAWR